MQRRDLTDDELCEVLAVDPLAVITGELDHRPELAILLALTAEAAEKVGPRTLRSRLRRRGPNGVPLEHLTARAFAAFEDDLQTSPTAATSCAACNRARSSYVRPVAARRSAPFLRGSVGPGVTAPDAGGPYSFSGRFAPGQIPVSH
jgi:hypothetical protein